MQDLPPLGESDSEVSHFIPEPRNFGEMKNNSDDIKKPGLKETLKEINILINNQTFILEDQGKYEPVTLCMDVYKANKQSDESLDRLNLIIMVRWDLQNKELVVGTWSPTASMSTLNFFLTDATKHKAKVRQLYFIGEFLQEKVKNIVFVNLDSRYTDYFTKYSKYFGRSLVLLNSIYGMTNSGKLFADELT